MRVQVSNTSPPFLVSPATRGALLEASFFMAFRFVVPDFLYERELKNRGGENLVRLGLVIEQLDGDGVSIATACY